MGVALEPFTAVARSRSIDRDRARSPGDAGPCRGTPQRERWSSCSRAREQLGDRVKSRAASSRVRGAAGRVRDAAQRAAHGHPPQRLRQRRPAPAPARPPRRASRPPARPPPARAPAPPPETPTSRAPPASGAARLANIEREAHLSSSARNRRGEGARERRSSPGRAGPARPATSSTNAGAPPPRARAAVDVAPAPAAGRARLRRAQRSASRGGPARRSTSTRPRGAREGRLGRRDRGYCGALMIISRRRCRRLAPAQARRRTRSPRRSAAEEQAPRHAPCDRARARRDGPQEERRLIDEMQRLDSQMAVAVQAERGDYEVAGVAPSASSTPGRQREGRRARPRRDPRGTTASRATSEGGAARFLQCAT